MSSFEKNNHVIKSFASVSFNENCLTFQSNDINQDKSSLGNFIEVLKLVYHSDLPSNCSDFK